MKVEDFPRHLEVVMQVLFLKDKIKDQRPFTALTKVERKAMKVSWHLIEMKITYEKRESNLL